MRSPSTTPPTLVLVSDLHMGPGRDARGRVHPAEVFHADEAFAAWLDALRHRAQAGEPVRLVLLGDVLDFTLVALPGARRLDMSPAAAAAKLRRAAAGHPAVFRALGRLAAVCAPLRIVPGNHDLELLHPGSRALLRALLEAAAGTAIPAPVLHPWFFHVPGLVYAEHGQQHHDVNRVPGLAGLDPERRFPASAVPAGTHLGELVLAMSQALDRRGDAPPGPAPIAEALRRRPASAPRAIPPAVRFAVGVGRWTAASAAARRRADRAGVLAAARAAGLPEAALDAVDRASERGPARTAARVARRQLASRRGVAPQPGAYLDDAARRLDAHLRAAGAGVPFYVFGHSHAAADRPIGAHARVLHTGTWSTIVHGPHPAGTFAEIRRGADGPAGAVLRWDGARATPLAP